MTALHWQRDAHGLFRSTMPLAAELTAFCDALRVETGRPVALGRPDDDATSLFVWPWRVAERPETRQTMRELRAGSPVARRVPGLQIHVLIFARPALTFDGLEMLSEAHRAITRVPIVAVASDHLQCSLETLAPTSSRPCCRPRASS
jgi:hypothetical protein